MIIKTNYVLIVVLIIISTILWLDMAEYLRIGRRRRFNSKNQSPLDLSMPPEIGSLIVKTLATSQINDSLPPSSPLIGKKATDEGDEYYWEETERPVLSDRESELIFYSDQREVIDLALALLKSRGYSEVEIRGALEFVAGVWRTATKQGIAVRIASQVEEQIFQRQIDTSREKAKIDDESEQRIRSRENAERGPEQNKNKVAQASASKLCADLEDYQQELSETAENIWMRGRLRRIDFDQSGAVRSSPPFRKLVRQAKSTLGIDDEDFLEIGPEELAKLISPRYLDQLNFTLLNCEELQWNYRRRTEIESRMEELRLLGAQPVRYSLDRFGQPQLERTKRLARKKQRGPDRGPGGIEL